VLVDYTEGNLKKQKKAEQDHDQLVVSYSTYAKQKANEILNYSNEIASLQKELETSTMKVLSKQVRPWRVA